MLTQWPLILAGTFLTWCAGAFGSQCAFALRGGADARKSQLAMWVVTLVLLVVGGLGILMRMQRWDRIFNSFNHLGSTITQAMIAMVVMAAVLVVFLVVMKRNDGEVPAGMAVLGLLAAVALAFTAGRMLVVSSRSVEDVVVSLVAVFGNALLLGPATLALVRSLCERGAGLAGTGAAVAVGSVVNAMACVGALVYTQVSLAGVVAGTVAEFGIDPTKPTAGMSKVSMLPFGADSLVFTVAAIVAALVALACALVGKKRGSWKVWAPVALLCGVACCACLRVVLLQVGVSGISMMR